MVDVLVSKIHDMASATSVIFKVIFKAPWVLCCLMGLVTEQLKSECWSKMSFSKPKLKTLFSYIAQDKSTFINLSY